MHKLSVADVDEFLDGLAILVEPVNMSYLWRPQLRDPKDEMVLETALNGRADALVTFNRSDFRPAAAKFLLPVLLPGECLARLEEAP